jgi:hypothetical protein
MVDRAGGYKIAPGAWGENSLIPLMDLSIRKRQIFFRRGSEIQQGDQDSVVLREK